MTLAEVIARPDVWRGDRLASSAMQVVSSGFAQLDAALPGGGWPRGALTELLVDQSGIGELGLLMPALANIKQDGGWSVLIAPPYSPHAPAWVAAGVDLSQLLVVSPSQQYRAQRADIIAPSPGEGDGGRVFTMAAKACSETLWASEQALASGAAQAVLSWCGHADLRQLRRLQVAAAAGNALAFLFRPLRAAAAASVAPLRLRLTAAADGLMLDILKRRGPPLAQPLHIAMPRPIRRPSRELLHGFPRSSPMAGHPATAALARSPSASIA